jgi:hypothetical protein
MYLDSNYTEPTSNSLIYLYSLYYSLRGKPRGDLLLILYNHKGAAPRPLREFLLPLIIPARLLILNE